MTKPLTLQEAKDSKYRVSVGSLMKACDTYDYLLARFPSGHQMGINCKIAPLAIKKQRYNLSEKTSFVSYLPCDFQTYISYKHGYFTPKINI